MKKKLLSVFLALVMVLALAGCGKKEAEPVQEPERTEDAAEVPETEAPETEETPEEPAPEDEETDS